MVICSGRASQGEGLPCAEAIKPAFLRKTGKGLTAETAEASSR